MGNYRTVKGKRERTFIKKPLDETGAKRGIMRDSQHSKSEQCCPEDFINLGLTLSRLKELETLINNLEKKILSLTEEINSLAIEIFSITKIIKGAS